MKSKKEINHFLTKLLFNKKLPKNYKEINILEYNKLDSLKIFKLLLKIESKYKIKISDDELFSNKFKKIGNLTKLIEKKVNEIKRK